jgi:PIN domain nuclease of toxin-antitoxin system
MRLILDTETFIWAVSAPERLSRTAMSAFRKGTAVREISVVSLAEIAINQSRGKLNVSKADAIYPLDHVFHTREFTLKQIRRASIHRIGSLPDRGRAGAHASPKTRGCTAGADEQRRCQGWGDRRGCP